MVHVVDANHAHAMAAVREVMAANMAAATKVFSILNAEAPHTELSAFPLVVPGEERGTVEVFETIRATDVSEKMLPVIHYQTIPYVLATIEAEILAAESKNRQHRWTPERAATSANKKVNITLPKFLTRALGKCLKADQIRDLAERIEAELWPRDLVFCQHPADYTTQFSVQCGGCMQVTKTGRSPWGHFNDGVAELIFEQYGLWPSSLVHYCPNVNGVFFSRDGKLSSRAFVWEDEKDPEKPWRFGYIRSVGGAHDSIYKALVARGYVAAEWESFSFHQPFTVPGVEAKGKLWIPMPNLDSLKKGFYVTRISEKEVLMGGYTKPAGKFIQVNSTYDWQGWKNIDGIPYADK